MFLNHTHRRKKFRSTTKLSLIRLIFAIGFAAIDTVWVIYMNSFGLSGSTIGFVSAALVILTILFSLFSTILLEKINEMKILISSLVLMAVGYIIASITNSLGVFLIISGIITVLNVLKNESFDIIFRDSSIDKELNENEGLLFTLLNVGWLVGPLVAGFFLLKSGVQSVFFISAIFLLIASVMLFRLDIKLKTKKRDSIDSNIYLNIKNYFSKLNLNLAYLMAIGVEIWWALIYIYVPLFILKNGLGEEYVGIFLAAIVVPLVLFEFEVGKYSQKYGFKRFFFWGFLLLSVAGLFGFFSQNVVTTLVILVLASIPMSFLEPIQESYFFKQIKSSDEEKYYPIFATSADSGSFIGKFVIALFLLFLPEKFAYLVISSFMILLALVSLKIKE